MSGCVRASWSWLVRSWFGVVLACALAGLQAVEAQAPGSGSASPSGVINLGAQAESFLDDSGALTIDRVLRGEPRTWLPARNGSPRSFGYTSAAIWVRAPLPQTSRPLREGVWRLDFRKGFLLEVDLWTVTPDGRVVRLLEQSAADMFSTRPIPYRHLALDIPQPTRVPGASADARTWLYIRYRTTGLTELKLELEPLDVFANRTLGFAAKSFMFQGVMIILVAAGLVTFVAARAYTPLMYAAYLLCYAVFVFHRDGFAFEYLWPGWPGFNAVASLVLGGLLVVAGSVYTKMFLQTASFHPFIDRILLANAVTAIGIVLAGLTLDGPHWKQWMVIQASASTLLFFAAGAVAARHRFREVRFFVCGWAFAIGSASLIAGRHVVGIELSSAAALDSMRMVAVIDALMMGLALIDRHLQARRIQAHTLEMSLANAQHSLLMHERFERLEQRYEMMQELADSRGQLLADATHDLRQPIHALRLTLRGLADSGAMDDGTRNSVDRSFSYLEDLVDGHLGRAADAAAEVRGPDGLVGPGVSGLEGEEGAVPPDAPAKSEQQLPLASVFANVEDMFADDASAKGLEFKVMATSVRVDVDALALMRMTSNLVANAIKYTEQGRVLVGCRRLADAVRIEVHDTGPGMDAAELERLVGRFERADAFADDQEGFGLGLAIVAELARDHGVRYTCRSWPGRGTVAMLTLPLER